MKYITTVLIMLLLLSCEPLDLKRVVAARTDNIDVDGTTVIAHGTVLDLGSASILEHGHCWSSNPNPTVEGLHTNFGKKQETGEYISNLYNIMPGHTHYVRSYVYNGTNYVYGEEREFSIKAEDLELFIDDIIKPEEVGNIHVYSYTQNLGSVTFSQHGHCWSRSDPPTIDDNISSFGKYDHDATFVSKLNNLNLGTYYIRAYLKDSNSVVYSRTVKYESYITIRTGQISGISHGSAVFEGEINSLSSVSVINHGHCWSALNPNPDINTDHNSLGAIGSVGFYNSSIDGLLSGLTYYVRAYAFDGEYYYYGEVKSFVAD